MTWLKYEQRRVLFLRITFFSTNAKDNKHFNRSITEEVSSTKYKVSVLLIKVFCMLAAKKRARDF